MGSKFFTWTKGDRRNAAEALRSSNGYVPVPVECIKIKGMDYGRTEKGKSNRKPHPLTLLEGSPDLTSKHSSRINDSIALHDAAVQSATSLMAVMSDMLRSPHLSAHLSSKGGTAGFRPRAFTAPSTPLAEAPALEPAELPGSFPEAIRKHASQCRPINTAADQYHPKSLGRATLGDSIVRPHSSPQEATHRIPNKARMSVESFYGDSALAPLPLSPRGKSTCTLHTPTETKPDEPRRAEHDEVSNITTIQRPSLSILRAATPTSFSISGSVPTSHNGSTSSIPLIAASQQSNTHFHSDISQSTDVETTYLQQIFSMRESHDAHLKSLKDAHEKEIATDKSYIKLLEGRSRLAQSTRLNESANDLASRLSPIETGSHGYKGFDTLSAGFQSFESPTETHDRSTLEPPDAVEFLKRKLSLYRKKQADVIEVRRDRDALRDVVEKHGRRVLQLKDIVRKAKENEKALKNANADLEARLVAANNERADVLEGFYEACDKVRSLSEREHSLTQELEDLRAETVSSEATQRGASRPTSIERIDSKVQADTRSALHANLEDSTLFQKLQDLQRLVDTKDEHIRKLAQESFNSPFDGKSQLSSASVRASELETMLDNQKQLLVAAQHECDGYRSLLHAELRRQSRDGADKLHTTSSIEAEAFVVGTEKMLRLEAHKRPEASSGAEVMTRTEEPLWSSSTILEKELEYCIKEIMMYKLDIRKYKKDLKRANAKVETLENMSTACPPTPGPSAPSGSPLGTPELQRRQKSSPANMAADRTYEEYVSGLGIDLSEPPRTPRNQVAAVTSNALLSATSTPSILSANVTSPPRTKTPLSSRYKKLPKPPSSPSPPAAPSNISVQRSETQRSLSESIVSSCGKRTTPEQRLRTTPAWSESPSAGSLNIPISKFDV